MKTLATLLIAASTTFAGDPDPTYRLGEQNIDRIAAHYERIDLENRVKKIEEKQLDAERRERFNFNKEVK